MSAERNRDKSIESSVEELFVSDKNNKNANSASSKRAKFRGNRDFVVDYKPRKSALQRLYARQMATNRTNIIARMRNMVAWTWIPGRDRRVCPPLVEMRDARLMMLDYFVEPANGKREHIGLSMFHTVCDKGKVIYAGKDCMDLFKDFNIPPYPRGSGLCLDARNEEVFRTALALDQVIELAAREKIGSDDAFDPPKIIFGFPEKYIPFPEWDSPLKNAMLELLAADDNILPCLLSPGGIVSSISQEKDSFITISFEQNNNLVSKSIPNWIKLDNNTKIGNVLAEGIPFAHLPISLRSNKKDIFGRLPYPSLDWLKKQLLEALTEMVTIEETIFNRETCQYESQQCIWRCIPSVFVKKQAGRAKRFFLDMRPILGRTLYSQDGDGQDTWIIDKNQCRIFVRDFGHTPCREDLQFGDDEWYADLMTIPSWASWLDNFPSRGN